jgi:hypothetical protein
MATRRQRLNAQGRGPMERLTWKEGGRSRSFTGSTERVDFYAAQLDRAGIRYSRRRVNVR